MAFGATPASRSAARSRSAPARAIFARRAALARVAPPRLARSPPSRPRGPWPGARPACLRCMAGARLARPWRPRAACPSPVAARPLSSPRGVPSRPRPARGLGTARPERVQGALRAARLAGRGVPARGPGAACSAAARSEAARGDSARPARSTPTLPLAVAPCVAALRCLAHLWHAARPRRGCP
jgi:hypothetical protein